MIKAIIFDFDGVILESAKIKTEAFAEVVKGYPSEQSQAFVEYHMDHMGISRHVKFKYFVEEILGEKDSFEKERELSDRFESIVYDKVMECPFVPGAKEFLEKNHKRYDLYVASGTPDKEIQNIVDDRGIRKYFVSVYGTPMSKEEIISAILREKVYLKSEVVFVGDARSDMDAATYMGLTFVGRKTDENRNVFGGVQYKVSDLMEIENVLNSLEQP